MSRKGQRSRRGINQRGLLNWKVRPGNRHIGDLRWLCPQAFNTNSEIILFLWSFLCINRHLIKVIDLMARLFYNGVVHLGEDLSTAQGPSHSNYIHSYKYFSFYLNTMIFGLFSLSPLFLRPPLPRLAPLSLLAILLIEI